jgi:hypothetical protein
VLIAAEGPPEVTPLEKICGFDEPASSVPASDPIFTMYPAAAVTAESHKTTSSHAKACSNRPSPSCHGYEQPWKVSSPFAGLLASQTSGIVSTAWDSTGDSASSRSEGGLMAQEQVDMGQDLLAICSTRVSPAEVTNAIQHAATQVNFIQTQQGIHSAGFREGKHVSSQDAGVQVGGESGTEVGAAGGGSCGGTCNAAAGVGFSGKAKLQGPGVYLTMVSRATSMEAKEMPVSSCCAAEAAASVSASAEIAAEGSAGHAASAGAEGENHGASAGKSCGPATPAGGGEVGNSSQSAPAGHAILLSHGIDYEDEDVRDEIVGSTSSLEKAATSKLDSQAPAAVPLAGDTSAKGWSSLEDAHGVPPAPAACQPLGAATATESGHYRCCAVSDGGDVHGLQLEARECQAAAGAGNEACVHGEPGTNEGDGGLKVAVGELVAAKLAQADAEEKLRCALERVSGHWQ